MITSHNKNCIIFILFNLNDTYLVIEFNNYIIHIK